MEIVPSALCSGSSLSAFLLFAVEVRRTDRKMGHIKNYSVEEKEPEKKLAMMQELLLVLLLVLLLL